MKSINKTATLIFFILCTAFSCEQAKDLIKDVDVRLPVEKINKWQPTYTTKSAWLARITPDGFKVIGGIAADNYWLAVLNYKRTIIIAFHSLEKDTICSAILGLDAEKGFHTKEWRGNFWIHYVVSPNGDDGKATSGMVLKSEMSFGEGVCYNVPLDYTGKLNAKCLVISGKPESKPFSMEINFTK